MEDNTNTLALLSDDEIANANNKELKKLMNKLMETVAETKVKLQAARDEAAMTEKKVELCILETDKLIPTIRQSSGKVSALRELDAEKQRGLTLLRLLDEERVRHTCSQESRKKTLRELKKKEATLLEEEENLNLQLMEFRESLAQVQSNCLLAEEELRGLQGHVDTGGSGKPQQRKQELILEEHVKSLDIPATLQQAGIRRRGRRK